MTLADPIRYLYGDRQAILRIASSRAALIIGAFLVLTAGIARNYDHLDLLREPEWFVAPFVVSFVSCCLVFVSLNFRLNLDLQGKLAPQFTTFLALFWLTSPCAWLYAIPVESFTDLLTATKFNLALLGIVALWRVLIITRAVQVLSGTPGWACLLAVLVPASIELCIGSIVSSSQLMSIMGGVRLPPHDELIRNASSAAMSTSFCCALVLTPFLLFLPQRVTRPQRGLHRPQQPMNGSKHSLCVGTGIVGMVWVAIACTMQPVQQRHHQLHLLLEREDYPEAIAYATAVGKDGFSSWHYLPPDPFDRGTQYMGLLSHLTGEEPAWLREVWFAQGMEWFKLRADSLHDLEAVTEALRSTPGGLEQLVAYAPEIRQHLRDNPRIPGREEKHLEAFDEWLTQISAELRGEASPQQQPSSLEEPEKNLEQK